MSISDKIQSLITAANTVTGESRTDLTSAVQDLKDGYGSGGAIPPEYQRIEYIEGTGTQYLDFDIPIDLSTGLISVDYSMSTGNNGWQNVMSNKSADSSKDNTLLLLQRDGQDSRLLVKTGGSSFVYITGLSANTLLRATVFAKGASIFKISNKSVTSANNTSSLSEIEGFHIFYQSNNVMLKGKLYLVEAIDTTLKCIAVPVRRIADGKAGMYDILNREFHTNKGEGDDFTKGQDI